ncbi:protein-L-isoaspartate O-methyltransferase [Microvirga sp. W0021]|uniref:Protein-L-isoaspartate O-methyltransferase n=1 Tax=Hohaiivirga grylli TaxID=3133970 RepID=A0ABV0BIB0_9HYPH
MVDFEQARLNMINSQIRPCDVKDPLVLQAILGVPRELYVAPGKEAYAYIDQNVLLSDGADKRFMLQPMVISRMIQALEVAPGDKVLDVACGYGYSSAVMAGIGAEVVALEADEALAEGAREKLSSHKNVSVVTGDLVTGGAKYGPYDAILVNGAVAELPEELLKQLKDGGRLVAIQSEGAVSRVVLHTRSGDAFGRLEIIDASAPILQAFHKDSAFVF